MITETQMKEFEHNFFNGLFPNQRYGQAFCNQFDIANSKMFYSTDWKFCRAQAWFYVTFDKSPLED